MNNLLQEQYKNIANGNKTWDDYSFRERTCKGWLLPYLLELDTMFSNRWAYWLETLSRKKMLDVSIPKIDFDEMPNRVVLKNLSDCLSYASMHSMRLPDFFEWLLWGFGEGEEPRAVKDEKVNEHWHRTFNLGLLLQNPYDYLGDLIADSKSGSTYWNNPNAFFATPHSIVEVMTKVTFNEDIDYRKKSVLDPCVGTGRMLLHASNYSLNLYGQDIDTVCIMACKINGYLYVPWLVKPCKELFAKSGVEKRKSLIKGGVKQRRSLG